MALNLFDISKEKKTPPLSIKAKEMLFYAKIFRFLGYAAAFFGVIVSALIYNHESGGNPNIIIEKPAFLLVLCVPLIPSIILAMIAIRKTKKFHKQAEIEGINIKALRK